MNRYPRTSRRRFRRNTPDRSGTTEWNGEAHGQREIRADEAALQHRDDWSRGPWQDDADGGDHQGIGGAGQGAVYGVRPDRQGAGGEGARHHDCDRARGIRDGQAALRARGLPRARRLREEHDHGRGADGRRDPGGVGGGRAYAADARAHSAGAAGRGAGAGGLHEQGGHGGRPGAVGAGGARGPGAAVEIRFSRRRHSGGEGLGAGRAGGQEPGAGQELDRRADERGGQLYPAAGPSEGPAVPDAGGGRVLDFGPRHGGDGSDRARGDQGRRGSGDRGAQSHAEDHGDRGGDVSQAARPGRGGGQRGLPAAGNQARGGGARPGAVQARVGEAAHQVQGGGLHPDQGGGGPAHAVFHQLPAAVLFPHDRRDRGGASSGGHRDGDAGRQRDDDGGADRADRDGGEAAVRHPRGRPHGGRRRGRADHRVNQRGQTAHG